MFFNRNFSRNCWAFTVIMCIASVGYAVPFSQYGLIQGVQDYSNNPFYNPNNGTIITPQVVYNPGPVLNNTDCISLVNAVIQNVCATQNNCKNKSLPDVRKDIMVTLSSSGFTGAASTCGGYIDYQFEQYKKQNTFATGASGTPFPTSFPTAQKKTTTKTDPTISKEQAAYNERAAELKALQAENGVGTDGIAKAIFPTTFQDLSFTQRNAIKQAGYEKYKDAKVYVPLNIEYDPKYAKSKGNGGGGGGGGGGNTTSECQKVYNCIASYAAQEEQVYKDISVDTNVTNPTKLEEIFKSVTEVHRSICKCTENIKSKDTYRKKLDATELCKESFEETLEKDKKLLKDKIKK